jgi:hypothetical protein
MAVLSPSLNSSTPSLLSSNFGSDIIRADFFFQSLKHFIQYVSLPIEIQETLKTLINHFAFILIIFTKYEELIQNQEVNNESRKKLGWLSFILGRVHILNKNNDIVQCICLLIAVITLVFGGLYENKITLRNLICGKLQIKTIGPILILEENIAKMIEHIADKEFTTALTNEEIEITINKLSTRYQQGLELDEIDERIFVLNEMKIATPLKVTPFIKLTNTDKQFKEPVKRVLTYETPATTQSSSFKKPHIVNKVLAATSVTTAVEMNNWLHDHLTKAKLLCFESIPLPKETIDQLNTLKESILENLTISFNKETPSKAKAEDKVQDINGLYLSAINGLLFLKEEKLEVEKIMSNKDFHKGVLAASTETVLFIRNSMSICFERVLELCELQPFEFWKIMKPFSEFDPIMPNLLQLHFQQIELKILTSLVWKESSLFLPQITLNTTSEHNEMEEDLTKISIKLYLDQSLAYRAFFQRILHIVSYKIITLSKYLNITDTTTKEKIWELMKYCLSSETDIFIDHHICQILVCAFYAVLKILHKKYTFNQIILQYIELYSYASDSISSLFLQVKTNNKTKDLITFYNTIFIDRIKGVIYPIIHSMQVPIKKIIFALPPKSFLILSLPSIQWQTQLDIISSTSSSPLISFTPRTKALYSFGERSVTSASYKDSLKEQILSSKKISECEGILGGEF